MFVTIISLGDWEDSPRVTSQVFAIGIELERERVEALFPIVTVSAPRHAGGRDPDHDWEGAARHVDASVAARGPLPGKKNGEPNIARAVDLMTQWFKDNEPPSPKLEKSIRRWIRENPHPAWWS